MKARATGNSSAGKMESERPAQLTVSLFGGVSLKYKGRRVDVSNHKGLALIGYLALTPGLRETRERIVGFLGSETEEAKARATLRQTLKELRAVFDQCGYRGFFTDRTEIGFEESSVALDVWLVLERLAAGRPHDLLLDRSRITETLLLGYEDADPSFRVWLLVSRENLRRKLIRGLEDQIASNTCPGEGLRRLAEALIQLDPTREGAYQTLMRCHAESGDLSGALSAYKQLWDLLDSEYDMEPSEKSQELVSAIKLASYTSGQATEETPVAERSRDAAVPSDPGPVARIEPAARLVLVIAAFDHGGLHADKQYIALGFRYELIWRLVRFREWALVDASPEMGGVSPPLPHYRLNANLFQVYDSVNVILTLHSGRTGTVIWSERYSLALTDFFATQQLPHRGGRSRGGPGNRRGRGPTKFQPMGRKRWWGQSVAASMGGSFNRRACSRKDFRRVFFLRKFFCNSVSINVAEACVYSGTFDAKPCAGRVPPPQLLRRKT
jgi:DNA-binding SARP family transcriptional activator/TolB-like protein